MSKLTEAHLAPLLEALKQAMESGAITHERIRDFAADVDDAVLDYRAAHKPKHPMDHRVPKGNPGGDDAEPTQ
jgi:hypothetical protein